MIHIFLYRGNTNEEQFDLILRASDCTDSDYEDSESCDESTNETRSDHLQEGNETMPKQAFDKGDNESSPADVSLSSGLKTPLLRKISKST